MGHVRDLPKSKLGVDIEEGFEPSYEVIASRKKVLKELKDAAKDADEIFVATDPDREGEAIGWHLAEELGSGNRKKIRRLMFNEITKKGVLAALEKPTTINKQMVDAQQARRVLDRLVGYKISPLLWDKVRRGLSAGRVQSVALKLVCDREREIERVRSRGVLEHHGAARRSGAARVRRQAAEARRREHQGRQRGPRRTPSSRICERADWTVASVTTKERKKGAVPPFITSKLQQAARFPVKKTMMIAQQLYEGIELPGEGAVGLITYMRTDSTRVSEQALTEVREFIGQRVRRASTCRRSRTSTRRKADAQDAHEAIRPTSMQYDPDAVRAHLTPDQYYLYRLIWNRFVASQMPPATFDDTTVDITAGRLPVPREGVGAEVPRLDGGLQPGAALASRRDAQAVRARTRRPRRTTTASSVLPPLDEGDKLELQGAEAGAEVHAAAAALQRSDAGEGARRERHRPAEHLRVDHQRHPGARVREQDRRHASSRRCSAGCWSSGCSARRSTTSSTSSYTREARRGPRQDRGGHGELRADARELLQEVRRRT